MHIEKIWVKNFRNYEEQVLSLSEGLNVLSGKNASGKTNLLESLCLCSFGKSPRTVKDKELIRWGAQDARVKLLNVRKNEEEEIELYIDAQGKKRVTANGLPIGKFSDLVGLLNVVYFSPDEMKLIKESPDERRRFMDMSLSAEKKLYLHALIEYNKILAERNKLLKITQSEAALREMFAVLDRQLSEKMLYIKKERAEFVRQLSPIADETHKKIAGEGGVLELSYETDVGETADEIVRAMSACFEKDFNLKYSSYGVHRDDVKIALSGVDVRRFGSQGQQRTAAIALKLSEIERVYLSTGEKPVLILDDVLSELDLERQNRLLAATEGVQTIISCTEFALTGRAAKIFEIDKGKVVNEL